MKRKLIAAGLCLALLVLAAAPAAALWDAPIDSAGTLLARGAALTRNTYWTGSDYRTENYITLDAGAALRPVAAGREVLCSTGSLQNTAAALEAEGLHVAAGVNGGFFNMSTLVPVGAVAENGVLRSAAAEDLWMRAVGFRADGGAVMGKPEFVLTLTAGETVLPVATLNRTRGYGLALFTPDFAATTKSAGGGWNVVCVPEGDVPLRGSVALTVERVETASGAAAIPAGRMLLSLAGDPEAAPPEWLAALAEGDALTLNVSCAEGWENVESAVGILYPLVEDGRVLSGLDASAAPRSAVGIRADGGFVLYTVDGRQSGYSVGAGLDAVAQRMIELGCVTAGALDGGASTNLGAVLPGDSAMSRINSPSGGGRNVANYIFLVTEDKPKGVASRLALYPWNINALAGAEIALTVKAVDENGYPAEVPENVTCTVSGGLGTVEDGVFHAERAGHGTLTAASPGLDSVTIPVTVVESPDTVALYGEVYGRLTTALTLAPGQAVDLTARATANHVALTASDTLFRWTLEPDGGTVDETGHIVPAAVSGTGTLTVSAGETAVKIPITVWSGVPFRDVLTTDEHFAAVKYAYEHRLFEGVSATEFAPETVMNRAMLVTVLWRLNGAPEAEERPAFEDVAPEDWFGPAVAWAAETGAVLGYSDTEFAPREELTKEQILTILWRMEGRPACDVPLDLYADGDAVSEYAVPALAWAIGRETPLIDPDAAGRLLPREPMTRAAVAEVLMRYLQ